MLASRWALALVTVVMATAHADPGEGQNDAGSGGDAGNTRATALSVSQAVTYGGKLKNGDIDWYVTAMGSPSVACAKLTSNSQVAMYHALGAETSAGTLSAPILVSSGTTGVAGIAGATPLDATLRVAQLQNGPKGTYDFRFDRVNIPSVNGDGPSGGDAGDTIATAMPSEPGCSGGHLTALSGLDMVDLWSVFVPANSVVTYSLGSSATGMRLNFTDASGSVLGTILPGGMSSVSVSSAGTYYLAAQRTTALGDVGYVIGAIVGPDPTGCRPYCLD